STAQKAGGATQYGFGLGSRVRVPPQQCEIHIGERQVAGNPDVLNRHHVHARVLHFKTQDPGQFALNLISDTVGTLKTLGTAMTTHSADALTGSAPPPSLRRLRSCRLP